MIVCRPYSKMLPLTEPRQQRFSACQRRSIQKQAKACDSMSVYSSHRSFRQSVWPFQENPAFVSPSCFSILFKKVKLGNLLYIHVCICIAQLLLKNLTITLKTQSNKLQGYQSIQLGSKRVYDSVCAMINESDNRCTGDATATTPKKEMVLQVMTTDYCSLFILPD